jgi:hypothetical protein
LNIRFRFHLLTLTGGTLAIVGCGRSDLANPARTDPKRLDHLLFRRSAPVPDGVTASESFRRVFIEHAPRGRAGNAVKDFQLRDRIFKNRCSFMIYSEMFLGLPVQLKSRILDRLQAALHDDDVRGRYGYLEPEEK